MGTEFEACLPFLMRPAGSGIPIFSTGQSSVLKLQSRLYGLFSKPDRSGSQSLQVSDCLDPKQVEEAWKKSWQNLNHAKVAVFGVPSDTGAGIRRGAASGPLGVREELLRLERYCELLVEGKVVDLGDIFVNPHLLHDEMLSDDQKKRCQDEMYSLAKPLLRSGFPVSALSQLKFVLELLLKAHPHLNLFAIGGDHSVAWPVTEVLAQKYPSTLGIVQVDAHTDLLPSRLGISYCFGTWSYHANEKLGKNGRLVQVGIRQSGRDRNHWESTVGVKQVWAKEIHQRSEEEVISEILAHLKNRGIRQIYFSNDIDGTDESEAMSTGTPASEGLKSSFVLKLIDSISTQFELCAADIMEVAPDLGPSPEAAQKTCQLAAQYSLACIEKQI